MKFKNASILLFCGVPLLNIAQVPLHEDDPSVWEKLSDSRKLKILRDPSVDMRVRGDAAMYMWKCPDKFLSDILAELFVTQNFWIRNGVGTCLIAHSNWPKMLISKLDHGEWNVNQTAAVARFCLNIKLKPYLPIFRRFLLSPSPTVREGAYYYLDRIIYSQRKKLSVFLLSRDNNPACRAKLKEAIGSDPRFGHTILPVSMFPEAGSSE